jgi:hypothetical protein
MLENVSVFPSLVWLWTWDVTLSTFKDFQEDPEYKVNVESTSDLWVKFWQDAEKNGFSLEYGTEDLYEAIRDWMIDADIVEEALDEDEDDVIESDEEEV